MCTFKYFSLNYLKIFFLCQPASVKIFVPACLCLLHFLIPLVLENMIYLVFGMFWILFLLGMVNFLQIPSLFLDSHLFYFLFLAIINFLLALEEAYKFGLDRKVFLCLYFVSFLMQLLLSLNCLLIVHALESPF